MNSKTSYTLCTSPSYKSCEMLPNSIFDSDIAKRLYLAQQKLRPVIDDVMRTATENSIVKCNIGKSHYLTVEQYQDAILASEILKEVDKIISEKQSGMNMKKTYNLHKFNLEKDNVKVNKSGKIYVDTSILIQLIELHKTLGDIINNARKEHVKGNDSNDVSSYSRTENSNTSVRYNSYEGKDMSSDEKFNVTVMHKNSENFKPKIRINVLSRKTNNLKYEIRENKPTKSIIQEVLPLGSYPLGKSIVVMSAHSMKSEKSRDKKVNNMKKLSTLPEERTSNLETNVTDTEHLPRKIKSTGSIKSDSHKSKVTDVAGARTIILNCLYDLKKVRSFLERVDIGVSAEVQINTAVLDENNEAAKTQSSDPEGQSHSGVGKNGVEERRQQSQEKHRSDPDSHPHVPHARHNQTENIKDTAQLETHPSNQPESSKRDCCCDSTYASDAPMELMLDAGDENASKLIICIKGKTEDEGDVQIIIRQCSECKNVGGKELIEDQITDGKSDTTAKHSEEDHNEFASDSVTQDEESRNRQDDASSAQKSGINVLYDPSQPSDSKMKTSTDQLHTGEEDISQDRDYESKISSSEKVNHGKAGLNVLFDPDDPSKSIVEPSKNVDPDEHRLESEKPDNVSQGAEMAEEKSGLNVIFDPHNPSKSIVEPLKKESEKDILSEKASLRRSREKIQKRPEQKEDGCSRIKLYETTNLCFSTDDGQELVISLTIRPKTDGSVPKLSLKDIFSESESTTKTDKSDDKRTQEHIDNIFSSENEITVGVQDKQHYEHFIPLSRTKICSSLEFDVSMMETRMRNKGIKHINPGIVVRLKELGVNNLLRACRPVKCGRAVVLNEKLRKGIPYSASLTSLPLEETDGDIIDQSLEMSFNKTKHSSKRNTLAYLTRLGNIADNINLTNKNMQISFFHIQRPRESISNNQTTLKNYLLKKKLSYYINLLQDVQTQYKEFIYEVHFFEIKKYHNVLQKSGTSPLLSQKRRVLKDNSVLDSDFSNPLNKVTEHEHKLISPKYMLKEDIVQSCSKHKIKHVTSNSSRRVKMKIRPDNLELTEQNCIRERKKFISKIPVYKYNRKRSNISEDNLVKLDCKSYIYDISSQSLPRDNSADVDLHNNGNRVNIGQKIGSDLLNLETCNKHWISERENNRNTMEEIIYNGQAFDDCDKTSDDSLELYFNNFFRDKYFSKLALYQKQSSCRSLKPRKKKSEYHCSRSHSQTCFSDSNINLRISNNPSNKRQISERVNIAKSGDYYKKNFTMCEENVKISQSVVFHFTRLFCEYWIKHMLLKETGGVKQKIASVKNLPSSIDILRNEAVQQFFRNIKEKILEEALDNTSRFKSQPNVEAGMDNEASSMQFNFTSAVSGEQSTIQFKEALISFNDIEDVLHLQPIFKHDKTNKIIRINNGTGSDSCDNFQNVIVTFESNTCANEFHKSCPLSPEEASFQSTEHSLTSNCSLFATSENTKCNIERIWSPKDRDPLNYLVYQNYFSSSSLIQRVIEKSKCLFKSNCGSNKQKHSDTVDYCFCPKPSPTSPHKDLGKSKVDFPKRDTAKEPLHDSECKICGCSIAKCQSKTTDGRCTCKDKQQLPNNKQTKLNWQCCQVPKNLLKKISSMQLKPTKSDSKSLSFSPSKRSVGMICIPKKADMGICAKLSKAEQNVARQCYCIKCEKRSPDGSCYCSHCLGIFDKSVGKKPSNKEIGTQCMCYKSKNTYIENDESSKSNFSRNGQSNDSNISGNRTNDAKEIKGVKAEPDASHSAGLTGSESNETEAKKNELYLDSHKSDQNNDSSDVANKMPTINVKKEFQTENNPSIDNDQASSPINVKEELLSKESNSADSFV